MPIWMIAWRSIQRRSFASLLTTFSMALGVMLVVSVLLIVGVVDESFRSNSSLGYDSIVGPKGGELQITLNTVYYLSRPVNNLPFEFYREFLPRSARTDLIANVGKHFKDVVECPSEEDESIWTPKKRFTMPPGETSMQIRVPLLGVPLSSPKEFTLTAVVTSKNTVNERVEVPISIQPGKRKVIIESEQPEAAEPKVALDQETGTQEAGEQDSDSTTPEDEPSDEELIGPPQLKIIPAPTVAKDSYAYCDVTLSRSIDQPVSFEVALTEGADGKYLQYVEDSSTAVIPVCLGDYYKQYRVVGTTPEFFDLVYDRQRKLSYSFADGRNFTPAGEKVLFEAILGAKVARDLGIKVGDAIKPAHGAPEGKVHDDFQVVGILNSSGTPQDRAVFVNMDGFNEIPDHKRADGKKEVTALLVDTKDAFRSMQLNDRLSDESVGQVVKPVHIIFSLFNGIVGPIRNLLLAITALICVVSGISILVSIYNSMNDRKREIAVMRSLGAGRNTVMSVVLIESVMISMAGGILGWILGHALIGLASYRIEAETGVVVSAFHMEPVELWLIPLLISLAIVVGFMPAMSAYRTDVAKALQESP